MLQATEVLQILEMWQLLILLMVRDRQVWSYGATACGPAGASSNGYAEDLRTRHGGWMLQGADMHVRLFVRSAYST